MRLKARDFKRHHDACQKDGNVSKFWDGLQDAFQDGSVKSSDFSMREIIEAWVPDGRELLDSWNPRHGGGGTSLSELIEADAVNTEAFSNISGQIVYNEVLAGFQDEEFTFSGLVPSVSTQFNGEKIAGIGAIGDLAEVVNEAHAYPMVGLQEDWVRTAETQKRGMIVPVTREALFYDRTGQLLSQAREVGRALGINKEKRAVDCVIDENTTAHRYNRKDLGLTATYGDNSGTHDWDNLQASNALLDHTDLNSADQLLNAITDPNTGEPVVITATMLICARNLSMEARMIENSIKVTSSVISPGFATSGNPTEIVTEASNPFSGTFTTVSSRYVASRMATDTNWFWGDPTVAFRYMENWPLATVQAPTNSELEFTQDIAMRWKASERGQYATIEPRAMVKSTA